MTVLSPDSQPQALPARPEAPLGCRGGETAVYVYCVVRAGAGIPPRLPGIERKHSPRLLSHGALGAVLSDVLLAEFDEDRLRERLADVQWLERAARTHEHVVEEVARTATAIPMRLCSVYRDEGGVRAMLTRGAGVLAEGLEHLQGKAEWTVKVFAHESTHSEPESAPCSSGTDYMRRRLGERDRRRTGQEERHGISVAIHERLSGAASEAVTAAPQLPEVSGNPGQMLLNGVYLVADERVEPFLALVDALQSEYGPYGLALQPTGPWPAYNFVPGTMGVAW
jgi:hypothetical protein